MRTRSEEKRRDIVRVAAKAFEELGYERTSMLTIAERLRGSKQTLYNYFPSKEDLLRAVLDFDVGEVADQALQEFLAREEFAQGADSTRGRLPERPARLLGDVEHPHRLDPAGQVEPRRGVLRKCLRPAWKRVADTFKALMNEGKLKRATPGSRRCTGRGWSCSTCSNGGSSAR